MSVVKSKRNLSPSEYVQSFIMLYNHTETKLTHTAKRKQKWLCQPIEAIMNQAFDYIMQANNEYVRYNIKLKDTRELAETIIRTLQSLQKPLLALWNVDRYPTKQMRYWENLLSDSIRYVTRMGGISGYKGHYMYILDYEAIRNADFLRNMCSLHRFTYSKVIAASSVAQMRGRMLAKLADEALYRVTKAAPFPKTKTEYEERKKDIRIAMQALDNMNVHLLPIFNLMQYSEKVMTDWAGMLSDELLLLQGLQDSDRKRFREL